MEPGALPFWRDAAGGGYVTVYAAARPGAIAAYDTPPTAPTVYAVFNNNGEHGKHEKRYDFKKKTDAFYYLILSRDPDPSSTQTKWELWEKTKTNKDSTLHLSGHLWQCESYHDVAPSREVGFKDCQRKIPYNPSETAGGRITSSEYGALARFASLRSEESDLTLLNAPIWISCTTGCCSLGQ
jgi:hypothetical protein